MAKSKDQPIEDIKKSPPADPTSRPVIIKPRPVLTDPTLVSDEPKDHDNEQSLAAAPRVLKIEPISDEAELKAEADTAKSDAEQPQTTPETDKPPADSENEKLQPNEPETPNIEPSAESGALLSEKDPLESKTKTHTDEQLKAKQQAEAEAQAAQHAAEIAQLIKEEKYALPINTKEKRKLRFIIIGGIVAILLAVVWLDVALDTGIISNSFNLPHTHFFSTQSLPSVSSAPSVTSLLVKPTDYMSAVEDFISAFQSGNQKLADELQSPAFTRYMQQKNSSGSFYAYCKSLGELCMMTFTKSYLSQTKLSSKPYTSQNGVKGEEVDYTLSQNNPSTSGSSIPSSSSASVFSIDSVPNGKYWQIDMVNYSISASVGASSKS